MTDRELMQRALDALEKIAMGGHPDWANDVIPALRARLAQPEKKSGLPQLPAPDYFDPYDETTPFYSAEQMREYATLAMTAQPEPEPVAWFTEDHREDRSATTYSKKMAERWREKGWPVTPLYTAPPQREWQGLTDEEIMSLLPGAVRLPPGWSETARAIEAALRRKNT